MSRRAQHEAAVNHFHELLFSLNIGFAAALALRGYLARFGPRENQLSDLAVRMVIWVNSLLHLRPREYNPVGVQLTVALWTIAVALILLLVLQFLVPVHVAALTLRVAGGITALLAVPASMLYAHYALKPAGTEIGGILLLYDTTFWLDLEAGTAVVCIILYFVRKWPVPGWVTGLLLAAHYSLWGWFGFQLDSSPSWALTASLVPPCSALAWILYVRCERRTLAATMGQGTMGDR